MMFPGSTSLAGSTVQLYCTAVPRTRTEYQYPVPVLYSFFDRSTSIRMQWLVARRKMLPLADPLPPLGRHPILK